ncbi:1-aminocyclopropane-1-carboxylate deaminase [Aequorivita sublithincola DSM 14238]|uniref:1-aminocyclopropane-1-carboxylate deaminase n=1 Tax=Aequorivita sublithincola (strain DSM 14238 / LMG 21431 / ACAM 643 / 9-3) TaxID=746697 RepID=I3YW02_AEQSU|nr:pyridoxal-phosphate dependent enzyme [Aequorivita sublithincola]AFL81170.1 1-aminocyclopropane-1-carboxylate deaminase [Aequorivita sublithincola DSM 14238]
MNINSANVKSQLVKIDLSLFYCHGYSLFIQREDLLHPFVSGNKFRKLKYNLIEARKQKQNTLLTFGGAFSNHIAAVAAAGKEFGFKTIGIIRGEELINKVSENATLSFARDCGMELQFVSREAYRNKDEVGFINNLKQQLGDFYLLSEGGTNDFAVKGCEEILTEETNSFDYICVPVGTGGTMAGLIKASKENQQVLGFSALKGSFQSSEIAKYTSKTNFEITDNYCFGGYGKIDSDLIRFINEFKEKTNIPLDPVYTGKMMYGIMDLLKKGHFKENSRIFAVHTGGLQGIAGMNQKLIKKNLPIIE